VPAIRKAKKLVKIKNKAQAQLIQECKNLPDQVFLYNYMDNVATPASGAGAQATQRMWAIQQDGTTGNLGSITTPNQVNLGLHSNVVMNMLLGNVTVSTAGTNITNQLVLKSYETKAEITNIYSGKAWLYEYRLKARRDIQNSSSARAARSFDS